MSLEWRSSEVDGPVGPLHVHRTGDESSPPLVLLHGFSDNGRCWERVAQAFSDRFEVFALDSRNHGHSTRGPGGPGALVDDVVAVLDGLGLASTAVIGHSLGARTAAQVSVARPELIGRLVLEDPPWTRMEARRLVRMVRRRRAMRGYVEGFGRLDADTIAAQGRAQHPNWDDVEFAAWVEAKKQMDPRAAEALSPTLWRRVAKAVPCPTLLVHGDPPKGGLVSPGVAHEVSEQNPNITAVRIEGAGHNIRRERFHEFSHVVGSFLDV